MRTQVKPFPDPPVVPTQEGPCGIRFDFNQGLRLLLPLYETERWHVRAWDALTGTLLADTSVKGGTIESAKKYFIDFGVEIQFDGQIVFSHRYCAKNQKVLIMLPGETLGDSIAWMPAIIGFLARHQCKLTIRMASYVIPLFVGSHAKFVSRDEECDADQQYATYYIGLFMEDKIRIWNPVDYRVVGLMDTAKHILGVTNSDVSIPPLLNKVYNTPRPIKEPYVCIAAQATAAAKMWLNPYGWMQTIAQIKSDGYRVICIDKSLACGDGIMWNFAPPGAEDFTGENPLLERMELIWHSQFFIGCSSGLAWLAWALGKPVVLISGFTNPATEFQTPYRVINMHACNSCWNEHFFDAMDFMWCPRQKNTSRHFECSHSITSHHVMQVIRKIPGYRAGKDLALAMP
jgi:autotransporter strand-loop-strand O-heptosyltransferase